MYYCCFSISMFYCLWVCELQHSRLPCPSPSPRVRSNSCVLCRRYHPTYSSFVSPLSFCPQSFPASSSFTKLVLCIRWPEYWNFSISPSSEYSELISFRIVWFDLLAVQGTLKSLLQPHNLKASVPQHSVFFTIQLSHPWLLE